MSKHPKEKRGVARIPYSSMLRYMAAGGSSHAPNHQVSSAEMVDLSHGGMRIRVERALHPGAVVQAWIPVSDPPVIIPVLTQVKWVREDRPGALQAGLQFLFR